MDESVKTRAVRKLCSECGEQYPADAQVCRRDGAALLTLSVPQKMPDPAEELLPVGTVLGDRYEVLSVIGSGGMGIVYKARHRLMDRLVAVKMLNRETIANAELLERFQGEAKTASMLSHPNIVAVFDYGVFEEKPYLVMDYVEGRSLEDLIIEGPIPLKRIFSIFSQAADALSHAHQKGVVHRDVKPSNIMIEQNDIDPNYVRVLDFGIAKLMRTSSRKDSGEHKVTRGGEVFGTAPYMSPEQCMGGEIGIASDIYSLGCVMYEALIGEPAIQGKDTIDTIYKQINDEALPLRTVRADLNIPPAIEQVVMKALRKDPNRRYATMHELQASLEEAFKPAQSTAAANIDPPPAGKTASAEKRAAGRRNLRRWLVPLAVAAVLVPLAGALIYLAAGDGTFKSKRLQAVLFIQDNTGSATSASVIPTLNSLAAEYRQSNPDSMPAIRTQERLTQLLEKYRPNTRELAKAKLDLAELFSRRTNSIRSKSLRREALQALQTYTASLPDNAADKESTLKQQSDLAKTVYGATSLEYAEALSLCAQLHGRNRDWQYAETEYGQSLKIRRQVYGETSDKYADALEEYGEVCIQAHSFTKAAMLLQGALEIREKLHGKESALSARSNRSLGKLYQDMGRTSDAESCLLAAIASQGAATGAESQEVAPILTELAAVYEAQHNAKQAQSMYKLALTIEDSQSKKDAASQDVATTLEGLSRAYVEQGNLKDAEIALTRAVSLREERGGAPLVAALRQLSKVLDSENKGSEAAKVLKRAQALEAQKKP